MMSTHDMQLVKQAQGLPYWAINEDDAETTEGKAALHDIIMRDYHREEALEDLL